MNTADFEAGTAGATITTSDAGSATPWDTVSIGTGTSAVYDGTHAAHGSLAAKLKSDPGAIYLGWNYGTQTEHWGRLYLYLTDRTNSVSLVDFYSGASFCCRISFAQFAFNLRLQDSAFTVRATSTTVISVDTPYRIEWHLKHGTGAGSFFEAKIFIGANVDGTTPDETISCSGFNLGASSDQIRIGNNSAANIDTFWLDDIVAAATSYPGPAGAPPAVAVALPSQRMLMGVGQ